MRELSLNARLLQFFIDADSGVGRIKLAKYAYLADLLSMKLCRKPISEFRYIFYKHGPFDSARFYSALKELTDEEVVTEKTRFSWHLEYRYVASEAALNYCFSEVEEEILNFTVSSYRSYSASKLNKDVVYKTAPMLIAEREKPIRLEAVIRSDPDPLGFSVERLLAGEKSARLGRHRPIEEAMRELRAKYRI
jgi:uncharacterized phage-associated protein